VAGFLHPISGLDHVVAMVAVGLWGAVLGPPALWVLPVAFPIVMAFGGMLGLLEVPIPGVEIGIAVSGLVMGLMVLCELRPPLWLAALIVSALRCSTAMPMARNCPPAATPCSTAWPL
jgi:urease accessory protein